VVVNCDGSCSGNAGPGGWSAILVYGVHERVLTGSEPHTTNNRMELTAAIEGLRALREPCSVTVRSDSRYVVDAFAKGWIERWVRSGWRNAKREPVSNRELWESLLAEAGRHDVAWQWVEGHAGDAYNERCDALAVAAAAANRSAAAASPTNGAKRAVARRSGADDAPPPRRADGYSSSPWKEFERKRWSEEARLVSCPECGHAAGRHARICSRGR
jgi:ribonuclease HI